MPSGFKHLRFADRMEYDSNQKTAISIRDGVLEYLGSELGIEPAESIFTVYRSPATIANATMRMAGIAVTDEHVSLDEAPPAEGGMVVNSEMIDALDEFTHTTIATKNKLEISDALRVSVESGKRELSLGYFADLVPHDKYDFEQRDIIPHHLAVVSAGRCGGMCSFIDRKPTQEEPAMKLNKAFTDESGEINLQKVAEVATGLPEALRRMPLEKLQELMPMLLEAIETAKAAGVETPPEENMDEDEPTEDEAGAGEKPDEMADMDPEEEEEKPASFSDSAEFKDAIKVAVTDAVAEYARVVEKARTFLDDAYSFDGKSTTQVMRDAIATESSEQFTDEELPLAFKMLKKTGDYKKFGDNGTDKFDEIFSKEL